MEALYIHFFTPLMHGIGSFTDALPQPLSPCLHLLALLGFGLGLRFYRPWLIFFWGGFLLVSASSQMAMGPFQIPTAYRNLEGVWQKKIPESLNEKQALELMQSMQEALKKNFEPEAYLTLEDGAILDSINRSLDRILPRLGFGAGRSAQRIKSLPEPLLSLALIYGGPAAHDVFTQEIMIPDFSSYPASRYFRIRAICHEAVHARGWVHERTTTLLEILAMLHADLPVLRSMGALRVLLILPFWQSSFLPEKLSQELKESQIRMQSYQKSRPFVYGLNKRLLQPLNWDNQPKKYGTEPENFSRGILYRFLWFFQSPAGLDILKE